MGNDCHTLLHTLSTSSISFSSGFVVRKYRWGNGSCLLQPYGMAARANLLGASYYFILCFSFHSKKTYSDEVIQINQLIYEELRVRKYIADEDLTEEARELKELYKRIWD